MAGLLAFRAKAQSAGGKSQAARDFGLPCLAGSGASALDGSQAAGRGELRARSGCPSQGRRFSVRRT